MCCIEIQMNQKIYGHSLIYWLFLELFQPYVCYSALLSPRDPERCQLKVNLGYLGTGVNQYWGSRLWKELLPLVHLYLLRVKKFVVWGHP